MGWFRRLLDAFFNFRDAKSFKCAYHNYTHYRDRVSSSSNVSEFYLHEKLIASLTKLNDDEYELYLTNAGYSTMVTMDRLNAILWYLRSRLDIEHNIQFRLKCEYFGNHPDHTYVEVNGRTYRTDNITITYNLKTKRIIKLDLDESTEIEYFMNSPRLSYIRKLYYKLNKLLGEIDAYFGAIERVREYLDPETYGEVSSKNMEYWNVRRVVKGRLYEWGFPLGIYSRTNTNTVKEYLKTNIEYFREVRDRARELAVMVKILTA
jgi:hypothetical protein